MKNVVLLDVLFYFIFPVALWNITKEPLGDYHAMLLSAVPGFLYTVIRTIKTKRINLFGVFILFTLSVSTIIDLVAGSGINLLWNNVYYQAALAIFFICTIFFRKPIVLYFSLDFTELQGFDRNKMKALFYRKDLYTIFLLITLGFGLRNGILAVIKTWLILKYGVEAFDEGIIIENIVSWGMYGLCFYGFFVINKRIQLSQEQNQHVTQ